MTAPRPPARQRTAHGAQLRSDGNPLSQLRRSQQDRVLIDTIKDQTPQKTLSSGSKSVGPLVSAPLSGCDAVKFAARAGRMGMKNLGNTCFMNAGLQCLSHIEPFAAHFLSGRYKEDVNTTNPRGYKGQLAAAFAQLQQVLWLSETSPLDPGRLHKLLTNLSPKLFQGGDQQDVQEFLVFCLDGLHEDLNRAIPSGKEQQAPTPTVAPEATPSGQFPQCSVASCSRPTWNGQSGQTCCRTCASSDGKTHGPECQNKNEEAISEMEAALAWKHHLHRDKSFIVDLLQGQLCSKVVCMSCGHTAKQFDPFLYLSVPVASEMTKVTDALTKFQEEELLTAGNQWYCSACCAKRDAKKNIIVWKLPPVLVLHMKRFGCDSQTMKFHKLTNPLSVPLELDLAPHCASRQRHGAKYEFCCVAAHQGKYGSGHYAACCRVGGFEDGHRWFFFDDDKLSSIPTEKAVDMASKHGYVLFFVRSNVAAGPKRQTVTSPECWPHLVSKRNSLVEGCAKVDPSVNADDATGAGSEDDLEIFLETLAVGDRVLCFGVDPAQPGSIRFIGPTSFAAGEWVGVELDNDVGKNNGTIAGIFYFTCRPDAGLFVRRSAAALRPLESRGTASPIASTESAALVRQQSPKPKAQPKAKSSTSSISSKSSKGSQIDSPTRSSRGALKTRSKQRPKTMEMCAMRSLKTQDMVEIEVSGTEELRSAMRYCGKEVARLQAAVEKISNGLDLASPKLVAPEKVSNPLQSEHKALLDKLLSESSDRLRKRLDERMRVPLDNLVSEVTAEPMEDLRKMHEKFRSLQQQRSEPTIQTTEEASTQIEEVPLP